MMRLGWRRLVLFPALAVAIVTLVAVFAWPGPGVPWNAARKLELPLTSFSSPDGATSRVPAGLRVENGNARGLYFAAQQVETFDAQAYRYFCFAFERIPRLSRPGIAWLDATQWQLREVAETRSAAGCVDLQRYPEWKGDVRALGVLMAPIDHVAPSLIPDPGLVLEYAHLESNSWRGSLAELWLRWSAYRPWEFRANSTGGFELYPQSGDFASQQSFVAALTAVLLLLVALMLGWATARRFALPIVIAAVAMLALLQLNQMRMRQAVAWDAAAVAGPESGQPLSLLPELHAAAEQLKDGLARGDAQPRIILYGGSGYLREFPAWLLRRFDVGIVGWADQLPAQERLEDTLLVITDAKDWNYDAARNEVTVKKQTRRAVPYFEAEGLLVFRFEAAGTKP